MKPLFISSLFAIFGFFALSGCMSGGKLGGITVNLVGLKAQAAAEGKQVSATLSFTNENVVPIGISQASYKLYINGELVSKTESADAVGLPQLNTVSQTVSLDIAKPELLRQLAAKSDAQGASYKLDTFLLIYSGEEKLSIKTSSTGAVDLRPLASK